MGMSHMLGTVLADLQGITMMVPQCVCSVFFFTKKAVSHIMEEWKLKSRARGVDTGALFSWVGIINGTSA